MNILSLDYSIAHKSLDIYISGCKGNPYCKNCHNPESWSFDQGEGYETYFSKVFDKLGSFDSMIDNVMLFGGEPLDQNLEKLYDFVYRIRESYPNKSYWLFTRYELKEIPHHIRNLFDYIKTGRYIEELSCKYNIQYGIVLSTSNQIIYKKGVDYEIDYV